MGQGGGAAGRDVAIDLVAGSLGATASVFVGQPLDTLKVKMQTFPHLYPNLAVCARQTLAKEGVARGLYAGTVPSLAANIAENSILFAAYGGCQKAVASATGVARVEDLGVIANGFSGFLAAFWSSLTLCPTELVKCRLQAMRESSLQQGKQPPQVGPFRLTADILRQDGVPGLFRGLTATFTREMPGYFFFFLAYEASRQLLTPPGGTKDEIGAARTIFSGGMAGVTLWLVIFPADVVKSRLQVSGSTTPMLTMLRDIYQREGFLMLYSGLGATLLRTFPATDKSTNMSVTEKGGNKVTRQVKPRWQLDFSSRSNQTVELPPPPGYSSSGGALVHADSSRETDPNLRIKRCWDLALGPFKQVPMNLFIMYMSGNSISIFPIMMVVMMMFRPFKTLFSVKQAFKGFETGANGLGVNIIGQKLVFILGNLANIALAMYKCHSMGLLPTHASDWLAFADPIERAEVALGGLSMQ